MIINMCITPAGTSDAKRPKEAMTAAAKDAPRTEGRTLGNSPKVRMLYDNMCFLLDQRKIYLDKDISLVRLSQMLYTNTTYLSRVINKYFGCKICSETRTATWRNSPPCAASPRAVPSTTPLFALNT